MKKHEALLKDQTFKVKDEEPEKITVRNKDEIEIIDYHDRGADQENVS